jgi:hypothetical protein
VTVFHFSSLCQRLISQERNEISEFHTVVATLHTHPATDARPDSFVHRAAGIIPQGCLYYEARVEVRIVPGHRTNYSTFATIKAETYLGIVYDGLKIEHSDMCLLESQVKNLTTR